MSRPVVVRASLARKVAREILRASEAVFPPVDARAIVQARAKVILFDDNSEDGMTVWDERRGKCYVYINRRRLNGPRANFTWAHEAGHICLEHGWLYDCNDLTDRERWVLDREANIFAVELLTPREWVEKYVAVPCDPPAMDQACWLFGVSREVLANRLEELGVQSRAMTEALARDYTAQQRRRRLERISLTPEMALRWAIRATGKGGGARAP